MNVNQKLKLCVISNAFLLIIVIMVITLCGSKENEYWNIGPNNKFIIINVHINTWFKYYWLLAFIALLKISQVIIAEIAHPIIGFNIYNPDKKVITEFTKNELQLYGNTMYMIDAIRNVLMIMITITQIDIAIFGAVISEITSIFTIRMLLNEKSFTKNNEYIQISATDNNNENENYQI
jgi:hypothetical protein